MYNFAIYYFIHAAKAKSKDSRIWTVFDYFYDLLLKTI